MLVYNLSGLDVINVNYCFISVLIELKCLNLSSYHLLRMFGIVSRRHLVLFVFLFSSCLIFFIGFWNGQDVAIEKRLKLEKQFQENSGKIFLL